MNIIKAQKEIFNAMLAGENPRKYQFEETSVFITPDGFHGFVIPYSQIQINLEKIADFKGLDIRSVVTEENRCILTREMLLSEHPRKYLRKLKKGNQEIFFNEKYMQCFQNPKFYNADPHRLIVVTEDISATRKNEIVGIILPVRVTETDYL